jgi:hypothetical protein
MSEIPTAKEINDENENHDEVRDIHFDLEHSQTDNPTLMIVETTVVPLSYLEDNHLPTLITCPNCKMFDRTIVSPRVPPSAYFFSAFFAFFFWPFMCIPFCTMQEYNHHCRGCNAKLC